MSSPRVGKVPPRELAELLYSKYKEKKFLRANVKRHFGKNTAVSVTRALRDGWLKTVGKKKECYYYQLSEKALRILGVGNDYVCRRTGSKNSCGMRVCWA